MTVCENEGRYIEGESRTAMQSVLKQLAELKTFLSVEIKDTTETSAKS